MDNVYIIMLVDNGMERASPFDTIHPSVDMVDDLDLPLGSVIVK